MKGVDKDKGFGPQQDDAPVEVPDLRMEKIGAKKSRIKGGNW